MGFMDHSVQCQHDAGDLGHPLARRQILQQASPEHVIHGPMASLVDRIALWVVWRREDPLNPPEWW